MWNQRYNSEQYFYGKQPNTFLTEMYGYIPAGRVLSLAEGEGRNGVFLARMGYDVTAVDSSEVGLRKARQLANEHGVEIKTTLSDLKDYEPEPESFTGVVSIFCHLMPDLRRQVFKRAVRALKPGGIFLLEAYTPQQLAYGTGGPPTVDRMISLEDLGHDLDTLEVLCASEKERQICEGRHHNGMSHVVQFIGKKKC